MNPSLPAALGAALVLACSAVAQQTQQPFSRQFAHRIRPIDEVPSVAVAALDRPTIDAQDDARANAGLPTRFAIPNPVQVDPSTHGVWDSIDAHRDIWRLRVTAPGASHVNLGFGTFDLSQGAHVQIFDPTYAHVVRRFTSNDNNPQREFWTPIVPGESVIVELVVPAAARVGTQLALTSINSGYRYFGAGATAMGIDGGSCNVDVACPQGAAWANEIPSNAAISRGGFIFCSGFMVNNTAQDGRPFFMTADHCGVTAGNASSLVAYWNYQNTTCNGSGANLNTFSSGAQYRAGYGPSDFTLVEFNTPPNPVWGVTFSGWDATGANATSAVAIHHPSGCEKKISFENQATTTTSYLGTSTPGDGTHVRVADWDTGTTEGGSSGSPLYNQNHQVIGQLHGGFAACGNNSADWYGKFSVSWTGGGTNSTRLSNWLDPIGTGQLTLNTLGGTQPGLFAVYGQGCPGADQTTGTCGVRNPSGGTLTNQTTAHEYAYRVANPGTIQIDAIEIFTASAVGGGSTSVLVSLYTDAGGVPSPSPFRAGLVAVASGAGFYRLSLPTPAIVTGDYYIGVDHTQRTTVVSQLTAGASGSAFRRSTAFFGAWSAAANITRPSFRTICRPIAQIPQIGNQGVARVNQSFTVTLADAPTNALALMFLGFSNTTWAGGPLPSPLPNAPGCDVLMSADDWLSTVSSGTGAGSIPLSVPNTASLVGIDVHHQWFCADAGANTLGVAVSAGATSTIGG